MKQGLEEIGFRGSKVQRRLGLEEARFSGNQTYRKRGLNWNRDLSR